MNIIRNILAVIDNWLCIKLKPWQLRLWYQNLWIRADEFHPSCNGDLNALEAMAKKAHAADRRGNRKKVERIRLRIERLEIRNIRKRKWARVAEEEKTRRLIAAQDRHFMESRFETPTR